MSGFVATVSDDRAWLRFAARSQILMKWSRDFGPSLLRRAFAYFAGGFASRRTTRSI